MQKNKQFEDKVQHYKGGSGKQFKKFDFMTYCPAIKIAILVGLWLAVILYFKFKFLAFIPFGDYSILFKYNKATLQR